MSLYSFFIQIFGCLVCAKNWSRCLFYSLIYISKIQPSCTYPSMELTLQEKREEEDGDRHLFRSNFPLILAETLKLQLTHSIIRLTSAEEDLLPEFPLQQLQQWPSYFCLIFFHQLSKASSLCLLYLVKLCPVGHLKNKSTSHMQ